jgi:hypothetical protein
VQGEKGGLNFLYTEELEAKAKLYLLSRGEKTRVLDAHQAADLRSRYPF